ncbi:MAG: dockerin type I domain-containing protein, partial [Thiogranum sp.]
DGDDLADGADGFVPLAALPGGVDADGDGFADGEQDFGTDPVTSNIGDVAPRGAPDNVLNAGDAAVLTRLVTGIITADALETALADLNADKQLNAADLLLLQQLLLSAP